MSGEGRRGLIHSDQTEVSQPGTQPNFPTFLGGRSEEALAGYHLGAATDKEGRRCFPKIGRSLNAGVHWEWKSAVRLPVFRRLCPLSRSCPQGSEGWERVAARGQSQWSPCLVFPAPNALRNLLALGSKLGTAQGWPLASVGDP